jgi:hypothetical protein
MWIMEIVWPATALYAGPLALWAYRRYGRLSSLALARRTGREPDYGKAVSTGVGVSHCGAGCTLGDIIGEWLIFSIGLKIAGEGCSGRAVSGLEKPGCQDGGTTTAADDTRPRARMSA